MRKHWKQIALVVCGWLASVLHAQTIALRAGNLIDPATGKVSQNHVKIGRAHV